MRPREIGIAARQLDGDVHGLPAADADLVCLSRPLADWYEEAVRAHPSNPKGIANWLLSELLGIWSTL